jgi:hypothetical protein
VPGGRARSKQQKPCKIPVGEFIEPGSPWQNPFIESFHSRVRDELLDVEEFSCLAEARVVISDWQEDYNQRRPHSALGMRPPAVFADRFTSDAQLARISGCAPIPVSSGRTDRHRLDPGGNRQLNHAFHMLAFAKILHDPRTAPYLAKQRRNGKTNREAIRSLTRHLVRRVYHLLRDPNGVPITICLT